ncbi:MAG: InlB B-repeat-containing protein, partial [Atribacterota bacterium]|nr:InlB B-repeat-containing protein [Atribacterota bacterium]
NDTVKITVTKPTPAPTPDKYTLTTTVLPADSGTVTRDGEYEQGDEVSITATSADGYQFVNWTDDDDNNTVVSEDASYTFNMPGADVNYTANFISVYEVSFQIIGGIPAGLSSRQIDSINLSGFKIEIFSDEARTDKITTVTTDEDGIATIKLPNGTYYFIASKERYTCAPIDEISDENYEVITLPTPIATLTVQGSFTISDEDISDTILIIAQDTYLVTFLATENNTQTSGVNREIASSIPLEGVTIEIYKGYRGTSIQERTAKEPVEEPNIVTLTTDSDGMVQIYLPNGYYPLTASKDGYTYFPPRTTRSSTQRALPLGYFEVIGADIIDDPVPVPMRAVYTVTFDKNNDNATDANPTTAEVTSGDSLGVLPVPPSLDDFTFLGWATTEDASGPNFDFDTIIEDDIIVYAIWCQETSLYSYGLEDYSFIEGYQSSSQTLRSKEDDFLYLYANGNNVETGYVTKDLIDFTDISFIEISWENCGTDDIANTSYLTLKDADNKATSRRDTNCITYFSQEGKFNKTNRFDVRAYNDSYHISIHARSTIWDYPSELKIYEIKLLSK